MDPIAALFGLACIVTLMMSLLAKDEEWGDALAASSLLMGSWAISNFAWLMNAIGAFPFMDVGLTIYFFFAAQGYSLGWRWYLVLCFVAQLCLHVAYACLGEGFYSPYAIMLNGLFGLQLLSVASTGVPHVRSCLSRLRGGRRDPV